MYGIIHFLKEVAQYLAFSGIGILLIALNSLIEKQNHSLSIMSRIIGFTLLILGLIFLILSVLDKLYILFFH